MEIVKAFFGVGVVKIKVKSKKFEELGETVKIIAKELWVEL
jgi:hypothetical protein